jgi:toxin ParE1/3/4
LQIFWTLPAKRDLDHIGDYIGRDNPVAAAAVILEIITTAESLLPEHTHIGKPGRVHGTRELVVSAYPSYILIYRARNGVLEILRVLHGARKWPDAPGRNPAK